MNIVFFDLETGGLGDNHPDIQIAAVATVDFEEVAAFESKIAFDVMTADPKALELNHYDPLLWHAEARPLQEVLESFAEFLRGYPELEMTSRAGRPYRVAQLAGHNAANFDAPRLQRAYRQANLFLPGGYRVLDTLQLALWSSMQGRLAVKDFKLATLCEALGIDAAGAHDALADVRMAAALARKLLERTA